MNNEISSITLTNGQKEFLAAARSGKNIFLTGNAGTGKSVIVSIFISEVKEAGKNIMVLAPTGHASQLIDGTTIHNGLDITPKDVIDTAKKKITGKSSKVLQQTDIVVLDEISMCRIDLFDFFAESIRKAEKKSGRHIQVIVVGDFFQLPPIIDQSRQEDKILSLVYGHPVGNGYAFQSQNWQAFGFENHMLTETMRQDNPYFIDKLNRIRTGQVDDLCMSMLDGFFRGTDAAEGAVYLAATRSTVDNINNRCLAALPGQEFCFAPYRSLTTNKHLLEKMPEPLALKVGAKVLFTKNENAIKWTGKKPAYYNGTLGTVTNIIMELASNPRYARIFVRIDETGEEVETGYVDFETYSYRYVDGKVQTKITSAYRAIPLQLAYAITIHKAQGITLPAVTMDPYCFANGQFYVGLSRCSDPTKLHFTGPVYPWYIKTDPDVIKFYADLDTTHARPAAKSRDGRVTYPASEKGGAPIRYPNGTKTIKIPAEILQPLKDFLDTAYPKKGSGTIRQMVNEFSKFLAEENGKLECGEKRRFPAGAKAMRIPSELSDSIDLFIQSVWPESGVVGSEVVAFTKIVKEIISKK